MAVIVSDGVTSVQIPGPEFTSKETSDYANVARDLPSGAPRTYIPGVNPSQVKQLVFEHMTGDQADTLMSILENNVGSEVAFGQLSGICLTPDLELVEVRDGCYYDLEIEVFVTALRDCVITDYDLNPLQTYGGEDLLACYN